MVRTTVGTIAEAELSVQQSEEVTFITANQTSTLASAATQTTSITASSGKLLIITGIRIAVPSPNGASSGTHTIDIGGPRGRVRFLLAESGFSDAVVINNGIITNATSNKIPADQTIQSDNIQALRADDTQGFEVAYENGTDVSQTKDRKIQIVGVERGVT